MRKMIFLRNVKTWLNPMYIVSVFRDGADWSITTTTGSKYTITDDEYIELIKSFNDEPRRPVEEKML